MDLLENIKLKNKAILVAEYSKDYFPWLKC